jgi:hypothetical protein
MNVLTEVVTPKLSKREAVDVSFFIGIVMVYKYVEILPEMNNIHQLP